MEDAFGNVVTSNTSTVTIAVASGPGGFTSGSTTSVAAASGVATFSNLVLDSVGNYTLAVSDSGLTRATTGTISVNPGAANKLVVKQTPSTGTAGQALGALTVSVEDAVGNVLTGNTSTVTIAVASGPGGLISTSTTSVAAVSGVATFSNLVLDTSGSYTLTVSDSGLTGATTGTISVSPATATNWSSSRLQRREPRDRHLAHRSPPLWKTTSAMWSPATRRLFRSPSAADRVDSQPAARPAWRR